MKINLSFFSTAEVDEDPSYNMLEVGWGLAEG